MAFAVKNVLEPMQLVTGGISGLAIMIKYVTAAWIPQDALWGDGIPLFFTTIILNIPLFIVAYKKCGMAMVISSLWGFGWLAFFLGVIPVSALLPQDYVLNTLLGGMLYGIGLALVLRAKASTGGTDLLASIVHKIYPYYAIPKIMAAIDAVIVVLGFLAFGLEKGLYALVTIGIISKVSETIITGFGHTLVAYIISDYAKEIAEQIMKEVKRGVTGMQVKGGYQGKDRLMLMCAVNRKQLVMVKEVVAKNDGHAFVIVVDAKEILGQGFREIGNNTR